MGGETSLALPARRAGITPGWEADWCVEGVTVCPARRQVAEWSASRRLSGSRLRITNFGDDTVVGEHQLAFVPRALRFSPDGQRLLVIGSGAGSWRDLTLLKGQGAGIRLGEREVSGVDDRWREQAEVLAGAWLDEHTAQLAGRAGDRCWIARVRDTGEITSVWIQPVGVSGRAQDWADCARSGRVVFGVRYDGDRQAGFCLVNPGPGSPDRLPKRRNWLIPQPASMHLSGDGKRFAWSGSSHTPHVWHIESGREVRCPDYSYAGPVRVAHEVLVAGEVIVGSDRSAFWICVNTDRGYRYCGHPLAITGRVCDLAEDGGRLFLAVTEAGRSSVYEVFDPVIQLLVGGDAEDRAWATRQLEEPPNPGAMGTLGPVAASEDEPIAVMAIQALGVIGTTAAIAELIRIAGDPGDAWRQDVATKVLADADQAVLTAALPDLLTAGKIADRRGAALIACHRPDVDVAAQLAALLDDPDTGLRSSAAAALGAHAAIKSVLSLLVHVYDQAADAREAVRQALTATLTRAGLLAEDLVAEGDAWEDLADLVTEITEVGRLDITAANPGRGLGIVTAVAEAIDQAGHAPVEVVNSLETLARADLAGQRVALAVAAVLAARWLRPPSGADSARSPDMAAVAVQATRFAETAGGPGLRWRLQGMLGDWAVQNATSRSGQADPAGLRVAARHYAEAMRIIDTMWRKLLDEDLLRGFFADKAALYDNAMWCSLRLGHITDAYEILEKSKTRYLGDLIARRHSDPTRRLEPVTKMFWRFARSLRSAAPADHGLVVSGLELTTELSPDSMAELLPERFVILRRTTYGDSDRAWAVNMVAQLWRFAARVEARADDGSYIAAVERYLDGVQRPLATLRSVLERPARATDAFDEILRMTGSAFAGITLPENGFSDYRPWALGEYGDFFEAAITGNVPLATIVVEAVMEVISYLRGAPVPVTGGDAVAIRARDINMPRITTTQLDAYAETHWQEIARIARGEIAGIAEATAMLGGQPDTALIEFAVTSQGTVIFLAAGGDTPFKDGTGQAPAHPLDMFICPAVTQQALHSQLVGGNGWLGHYRRATEDYAADLAVARWQRATDRLAAWLHEQLLEPILPWLEERHIRRLIVIPHRGLHMLPLGAWRSRGDGRYLIDRFDVSYAPSLTIREICRRRRIQPSGETHLVSVCGPPGWLKLTVAEARLAASELRPDQDTLLCSQDADRDHWSASSPDATHTHYTGHGHSVWSDALSSALELTDGQLTLGDLFDGAIPLNRSQLTVLSACETTMTDPADPADEYLSISAGFIFEGTPVVLSTRWAVDDTAALLIAHRFYRELAQGRSPSSALTAAQRWLRNVRHGAIASVIRQILASDIPAAERPPIEAILRSHVASSRRHPLEKPLSHPITWAAFVVAGVEDAQ